MLMEDIYGESLPKDLNWAILGQLEIRDIHATIDAKMKVLEKEAKSDTKGILAFQKVTEPVTLPGAVDDCRTQLHPARWLRMPVAKPDLWGKQVKQWRELQR